MAWVKFADDVGLKCRRRRVAAESSELPLSCAGVGQQAICGREGEFHLCRDEFAS